MKGVARISFQGGGLFLSVKTPYEREVFFEHVDQYAKRHGRIHVELNQRECNVTSSNGHTASNGHAARCAACDRPLDSLTYALSGRDLCMGCARLELR